MEREVINKNQIISQLIHIGHGDLNIYRDVGIRSALEQDELLAHFISWNRVNGKVRDSKVALPVCALRGFENDDYMENAVANLCMLDPRELLKAVDYHQNLTAQGFPVNSGAGTILKKGVKMYLNARQGGKLAERSLLTHKHSLKQLFKMYHVRPSKYVQHILFGDGYKPTHEAQKMPFRDRYPRGSVFDLVSRLKNMPPKEAAGVILTRDIPFIVAIGALGGIKDKTDIIMALLDKATGNQLINFTNSLSKMGVFENPTLSAAYDAAIERAKKDKRTSTLKSGQVKTVSKKAAVKLKDLGDEKLAQLGGIEGDWLVLGDKSTSMRESIEIAKEISALVSQQVKGKVYLIFFNSDPQFMDVSGKDLDEIKNRTKGVRSSGMTSIGVGIDYILQRNLIVNGIIIVSDGGENTRPLFGEAYNNYVSKFGLEPTVYHIRVKGDPDRLLNSKVRIEKLQFGKDIDYNSLPNLIPMLRANRYQLLDEVMEAPLLTFNDVFRRKEA